MKKYLALSIASLLFTLSNVEAAEPLEFQQVMKDLSKNMQIVTDGIAREDWALVAKTSHLIGTHPQPPMAEKMRIMSFMGSDMPKFKGFDMQTHDAAHAMEKAAEVGNGEKVIASYQQLQTACLSCHQAFRPAFVKHFHDEPAQ